jgi:hypothetical protein
MAKVQKDTMIELMAKFTEFFEADTVEKATEAAHNQKMPDDNAKIESLVSVSSGQTLN